MEQLEQPITYEERIVAFADIMGFSEMLKLPGEKALERIALIRDELRDAVDFMKGAEGLDPSGGKGLSVRLFSDCLCVSTKLDEASVGSLFFELADMQLEFARRGIFFRGAVTVGRHYEDELMIFSEALAEAHKLEQQAVYPRILVADRILDDSQLATAAVSKGVVLVKAPDGVTFIDYLGFARNKELLEEALTEHRDVLLENLQKHRESPRVLEKYRWAAEYHNHVVSVMPAQDLSNGSDFEIALPNLLPKFEDLMGSSVFP